MILLNIILKLKKIAKYVKFEKGNLCYITGGSNRGRIGQIVERDVHEGGIDIVHVKDVSGVTFTTRLSNVFVIGPGNTSWISLPRGKGLKLSNIDDRKKRILSNIQKRKPRKAKKSEKKKRNKNSNKDGSSNKI